MTAALNIFAILCAWALIGYLAYESAVSLRKYRLLKEAIAAGDSQARSRFYYDILLFEGVSAILACAALRFDPARLNPSRLQMAGTRFGNELLHVWSQVNAGFLIGLGIGAAMAVALVLLALRRSRQHPAESRQLPAYLRKILPDFSALIPTTIRERWLFALVAISAGICEEVVFRGWLLDALHGPVGLEGGTLVLAAASLFGIAHYYQGISGVLVTGVLGFVFCGLYIATGSLLVPIIIHALIDLRIAVFPSVPVINSNIP